MGNALCCTTNQDLGGLGKPEYYDMLKNEEMNRQDQNKETEEQQQLFLSRKAQHCRYIRQKQQLQTGSNHI